MNKKILYLLIFFFLLFFSFSTYAHAIGMPPGGCRTSGPCSTDAICCTSSGYSCTGGVCAKAIPPQGGTGTGGTTGTSTTLQDISNLLNRPPGGVPQTGYQNVLSVGITLLIIAAVLLSLFFLIWGGFDWITSGGDKQKLHQARQKITLAIIGLVIVFLAFFVVNLVYNFFSIGGSRLPQPPNAHIGGK